MNEESGNSSSPVLPDLSKRAEEKMFLAKSFKLEGNNFFKQQNLKEAIRHYHRALLYIKGVENDGSSMLRDLGATFTNTGNAKDSEDKIDPVILKQNTELKLDCYNNLSACLLKTKYPDYEKILFYCKEVMKCTRQNPKTHFRMALALFELGDFNAALESCNEALHHGPSQDSMVTSLKRKCIAQLAKKSCENKAMYGKMLGLR